MSLPNRACRRPGPALRLWDIFLDYSRYLAPCRALAWGWAGRYSPLDFLM